MFRNTQRIASILFLVAGLLGAFPVMAQDNATNLRRIVSEFQNNHTVGGVGEISTTAAATAGGTGGTPVYTKTFTIPNDVDVLYVTFSAQGDTHRGSALLMNATVNGTLIQPLAGQTGTGGGGPHVQTGWYTLLILPVSTTTTTTVPPTNCNDGGGGTADCHDNAIYFSGCINIGHHNPADPFTVVIKLANLPGGDDNTSFYERSTIYIDGQKDTTGNLCKGVGTGPH